MLLREIRKHNDMISTLYDYYVMIQTIFFIYFLYQNSN